MMLSIPAAASALVPADHVLVLPKYPVSVAAML
jgi:hypothetical protein